MLRIACPSISTSTDVLVRKWYVTQWESQCRSWFPSWWFCANCRPKEYNSRGLHFYFQEEKEGRAGGGAKENVETKEVGLEESGGCTTKLQKNRRTSKSKKKLWMQIKPRKKSWKLWRYVATAWAARCTVNLSVLIEGDLSLASLFQEKVVNS